MQKPASLKWTASHTTPLLHHWDDVQSRPWSVLYMLEFSISWCRQGEGAYEGSYTNETVLTQRLLGTVGRMNGRRRRFETDDC